MISCLLLASEHIICEYRLPRYRADRISADKKKLLDASNLI